ncbi:MAG: hypothetical protein NUV41_16055 [Eubacteriales bacterium]|jgi:hypothetical protein|nr:hypothetical protein [Eubacteriales bacterium]
MINANVIRPYRRTTVDFDETEQLKQHLHSAKQIRSPFYLVLRMNQDGKKLTEMPDRN